MIELFSFGLSDSRFSSSLFKGIEAGFGVSIFMKKEDDERVPLN